MTEATTEADLRSALRTLVPDDLDATDFRARLDRLLLDEPAASTASSDPATGPDGEDDLVVVPTGVAAPRRLRSRAALVVTLAACVAAVLAIALAVVPHGDRHSPPVRPAPVTPAKIRSMLFPGTVVLGNYRGRGSSTVAVPRRGVPANYSYTIYGTCHGSGKLGLGDGVVEDCQYPGAVFGISPLGASGRLAVTADPATTWQLTAALAPDARTNGGVENPPDAGMKGPNSGVRQSGRGSAHVTFTGDSSFGPDAGSAYFVNLVCHGTGVTMPDLTGDHANGLSTKTCFAGRQYTWQNVRLTTPATVRVVASPGTTWTIVISM